MPFTVISTIVIIIYFVSTTLAAGSSGASCIPSLRNPLDGFHANFFKYLYPDYAGESTDEYFITTGYNQPDRYITTITGITDINFYHFYNFNTNGPTWGQINDYKITISNFTVEYTGWFIPKESGNYIFQIGQTDDGSRIEIYEDSSYRCCDTTTTTTVLQNIQYYDSTHMSSATVEMEAGIPYPIKVVYFNKDAVAIQTIQFTDPSGTIHTTFEGYIVYYDDVVCPSSEPEDDARSLPISVPIIELSSVELSSPASSSPASSSVASSSIISSNGESLSSTFSSITPSVIHSPIVGSPSRTSSIVKVSLVTSSSLNKPSSLSDVLSSLTSDTSSDLDDTIIARSTTILEGTSSNSEYSTPLSSIFSLPSDLPSSVSLSSIFSKSSSTMSSALSSTMSSAPSSTMSSVSSVSSIVNILPISAVPDIISVEMNIVPVSVSSVQSSVKSIINSSLESSHTASSSILARVITSSTTLGSASPPSVTTPSVTTPSIRDISATNSSSEVYLSINTSQRITIESHSYISYNKSSQLSATETLSLPNYPSNSINSLVSVKTTHSNITSTVTSNSETNEVERSNITINSHLGTFFGTPSIKRESSSCVNTVVTSEYSTVSTSYPISIPPKSSTDQPIILKESKTRNVIISTVSGGEPIQKGGVSIEHSGVNTQTTKLIPVISVQSVPAEFAESTPSSIQVNINEGISIKGNGMMTYLVLLILTSFF